MSTWDEIALFVILETALVATAIWFGWQLRARREERRR